MLLSYGQSHLATNRALELFGRVMFTHMVKHSTSASVHPLFTLPALQKNHSVPLKAMNDNHTLLFFGAFFRPLFFFLGDFSNSSLAIENMKHLKKMSGKKS